MFITNKAGFSKKSIANHPLTHKDYEQIRSVLLKFAKEHQYHIFTKMKPTGTLEMKVLREGRRNVAKTRAKAKKKGVSKKTLAHGVGKNVGGVTLNEFETIVDSKQLIYNYFACIS